MTTASLSCSWPRRRSSMSCWPFRASGMFEKVDSVVIALGRRAPIRTPDTTSARPQTAIVRQGWAALARAMAFVENLRAILVPPTKENEDSFFYIHEPTDGQWFSMRISGIFSAAQGAWVAVGV